MNNEITNKLLSIHDLTIDYTSDNGSVHAVRNLELEIGYAETLGFVGETGAGKTTTALGIMRLVPDPPGVIRSGEIVFEGVDLLKESEEKMRTYRGFKISMIFQDPMTSLNPVLTVGDQIEEVIALHENLGKKERRERAAEMLETVGIKKERINDYPHQFSGGMKQRVVIAMALACNPKLIIADEPTTALDVTIQAQVLELMKDLKKKYETSMIMITHDLGIVAEICDNVAIMYAGSVVEYGSVERLYNNPLHPYTHGLFNSIPSLDKDETSLHVIPGSPPNPADLPSGCPFSPRCSKAMDVCRQKIPPYFESEQGHKTACWLFDKEQHHESE